MTRIPRKQIAMKFIAMKFKDGKEIEELAWEYRKYFGWRKFSDGLIPAIIGIEDVIRQYMKKQKP